jgi:hypothetical protein
MNHPPLPTGAKKNKDPCKRYPILWRSSNASPEDWVALARVQVIPPTHPDSFEENHEHGRTGQTQRWFASGTEHSNSYSVLHKIHDVLPVSQEDFEGNQLDGVSPHSEHSLLPILLQ